MAKQPTLPIPISAIQNSYLIFDAQAVSWLRRTHSICGSFIGTLHQNPSQNVFLALPLEIMPEEAQYLVEQGIAYILDDARAHDELMHESSREVREMQIARLREQGVRIAETKSKEREEVSRRMKDLRMGKGKKGKQVVASPIDCEAKVEQDSTPKPEVSEETASFFDDPPPAASIASLTSSTTTIVPTPTQTEYTITPSNSFDVLSPTSHAHPSSTPHTSYPGTTTALRALTTHLHSSATTKYFLHPGLRFGAHYSVYPGDPLRYHSHFLARAVDWDEEIDLMDLVAGGRLGTGVKKGYLLGGKEPPDEVNGDGRMRTFSIEWAAM